MPKIRNAVYLAGVDRFARAVDELEAAAAEIASGARASSAPLHLRDFDRHLRELRWQIPGAFSVVGLRDLVKHLRPDADRRE